MRTWRTMENSAVNGQTSIWPKVDRYRLSKMLIVIVLIVIIGNLIAFVF